MSRADKLKKNSISYFDAVAAEDEEIPEPVLCYPYVLELLKEGRGKLLDIGCGTGEVIGRIIRQGGYDYELNGLDISPESLKKAEEKCGEKAAFFTGDVENMPFADEEFDVLLCMHSFHHYPHPRKALAQMRRILKATGQMIIVENDYSFYRRNRMNLSFVIHGHPDGDVRMYSKSQMAGMIRKAGFTIKKQIHIAEHSQLIECRCL